MKRFLIIVVLCLLAVALLLPAFAEEAGEGAQEPLEAPAESEGTEDGGEEWYKSWEGWQAWIREKGIPGAIFIITTLGTIYIGCTPVISKIIKSGKSFEDATAQVEESNEETKASRQANEQKAALDAQRYEEMQRAVGGAVTEIRLLCERVLSDNEQTRQHLQTEVDSLRAHESATLRICTMAFGQDPELVRRGVARQIVKLCEGAGEQVTAQEDATREEIEVSDYVEAEV